MSKAEVKILQEEIKTLNKQLYESYDRIIELLKENTDLKEQAESQQDVINALAESLRGQQRNENV